MFESCFPQSGLLDDSSHDMMKLLMDNATNAFPLFHVNATYVEEYDMTQRNFSIDVLPTPAATGLEANDINGDNTTPRYTYDMARYVLKILHPAICIFGLMGNVLTLLILTRKRLKMSCDGTERTVHTGFTALAVSDLLFCLALLPYGLLGRNQFAYYSPGFQLVYETYSGAAVNMFILTSTWLTVTMATSRYLAICHPFRARHVIGMTGTKRSILLVFAVCALFNIPRMLMTKIGSLRCIDGSRMYFKMPGYLATNGVAHTTYIWTYFTIGILFPLTALAFCNICLVRALHESAKIRRRYRVPAAHVDSNYRITAILVTIVVMYIVLVSPAEILLFVQDRLSSDRTSAPALVLAVEVTNLLQMINFSCNFVLYFILNVHFRRALRDMFDECYIYENLPRGKHLLLQYNALPIIIAVNQ
ncbi:hypothetical protein LSH36_1615g00011 [Paralvinella palmiformis]|uniref:G-protein coupled receptors family 1 profile domain-containing protein n=1 Tax=Paralvinella palmiformis TaxID=53620 RepID=A0AAD9ISL3_9ANNE|nr:hypothetical protein LSH36_1615g00011 [Paralvinella palmiformis]